MSTDHWKQPEGDRIATNYSIKTAHVGRGTNERDRIFVRSHQERGKGRQEGNVLYSRFHSRQIYGDLFPQKWRKY